MMLALHARPLSSEELATDHLADKPTGGKSISVLQLDQADATFEQLLRDDALLEQIDQLYTDTGAVLLRGLPIADTHQAERLLSAWGVTFDDEYLGGASPRSKLSDHFFTSTEAPPSYVISFHTEMCYLKQRPGKIFFYCITEPERYGETPVFNTAAMLEMLSPATRDKVERLGMIYQRYFGTRKAKFFNVYKTWYDAFHAETREQAEEACRQQGLEWEWQSNGGLITRAKMPGVMLDATSGQPCISLTLYNGEAAPYDLSKFAHRIPLLQRLGLSTFIRAQYVKKNVFMRTLWGDGSPISRTETRELIDVAWRAATMFRWRQGDLLILDNIRCGHGRLNVEAPRKIAAALGDPYQI
jgi:alpha-ketoglutarate-dependent taurine dioxygenase